MYSYWDQFHSPKFSPEFIQELERRTNAPQVHIHVLTGKKLVVSANQLKALYKESRDFRNYVPYAKRRSFPSYIGT
jgi:hypothetical protein